MTHTRAVFLGLAAIVVCSGVALYRGQGWDPRRLVSIALCGAAVLFVAAFQPGLSAGMSGLLLADVLVLNKQGAGLVAAVGNIAAPGASTKATNPATGTPAATAE